MKGLVYHGPGQRSWDEVPDPTIEVPTDAVIRSGGADFRIAPLTDLDADELVQGDKAGRLVRDFRGAPAADAGALVSLLHRLSQLAFDLPEVAELDLNPVLGLPTGCMAVDARIRLRARPADRALKSS